MARNMIDYGNVGYIQIDAGRIGGLSSAYEIGRYAEKRDITYVNHTFTTSLALSASLQAFAGLESSRFCEVPVESSLLARDLTMEQLGIDGHGVIQLSEKSGLGVTLNMETVRKYIQPVEIRMGDKMLYSTPNI